MKFGQRLEQESVPEWSIHNVDYNSLKYEIKIHTRRDQARAMAIPGQSDDNLRRFEDGFYEELCRQHDRVGMFVSSKAAEISTRLDYLDQAVARLAIRCAREPPTLKCQKRLLRYQHEALRCGDDVQALFRFTRAQSEAFRKILKKYKKWTGSAALGERFREHVLSDPKSFTRRDLTHLRARYDATRDALRSALPDLGSEPSSPGSTAVGSPPEDTHNDNELPPPGQYWNEYDHGSEGEGGDEGYALYITPDEEGFPGWGYISAPFSKAKLWLQSKQRQVDEEQRQPRETDPLLSGREATYPAPASSTDGDADLSSDDELPPGYATYHALPSLSSQRLSRYRARMLLRATAACLVAAALFAMVAGVLLSAGRRRRRAQVDAGAGVGVVASVFAACGAVGMDLVRGGGWWWRVVVWVVAGAVLVVDGMLLVLVVEG